MSNQPIDHRDTSPPTDELSAIVGEPSASRTGPITVVVGRFSALVGLGLTQILREDQGLRILGTDLDNAALAHIVARRAAQVAILDESTTVDKASSLERLRTAQPTTGIVVLAHRPALAYGMRLLAAGASCMSKDASAADLLAAVRVAADGRRVFASDDGHLVERSSPNSAAALTQRETEVLEYLSRARSHAEIAHALQLGVETVRTHSAHIRRKLGVRSNRELIGLRIPIRC
jgi:DNA-binding NarL/FixJ family response regulator